MALTVSEIALADGDNFAADLARYGVADGRAVRLLSLPVLNPRASDFGTSLAAASLPFTGILRSVERGGDFRARLALGDVTERMATPSQPVDASITRKIGAKGLTLAESQWCDQIAPLRRMGWREPFRIAAGKDNAHGGAPLRECLLGAQFLLTKVGL